MRGRFMVAALAVSLTLGGLAVVAGQTTQESAEPGAGGECATPFASPGASPFASPMASPLASPDASPMALIECATPAMGTPAS